jgi:pancreatic triacylglycerol lipase
LSANLRDGNESETKYRWEIVPDSEGHMHLVDLNAYNAAIEPLFVAEKDMKFVLFTQSVRGGEEITMNVSSLDASSFNKNHPTRLTIHGWNGDETSLVNSAVIQEYLNLGDFNCIMVDWSRGAGTLDYIAARNRLYDVATFTALFVEFLFRKDYLHIDHLHIVGHSLG